MAGGDAAVRRQLTVGALERPAGERRSPAGAAGRGGSAVEPGAPSKGGRAVFAKHMIEQGKAPIDAAAEERRHYVLRESLLFPVYAIVGGR